MNVGAGLFLWLWVLFAVLHPSALFVGTLLLFALVLGLIAVTVSHSEGKRGADVSTSSASIPGDAEHGGWLYRTRTKGVLHYIDWLLFG